MKKIGLIGHTGIGFTKTLGSNTTLLTISEINQKDIEIINVKKELPHIFGVSSIGNCKKGHSYRVDLDRTETKETEQGILLTRKWTCIKCGRHLEKN